MIVLHKQKYKKSIYPFSKVSLKNKSLIIYNSENNNKLEVFLRPKFVKVLDFKQLKFLVHNQFLSTFLTSISNNLKGVVFGWYTKLELCSRNFSAYKVRDASIPYFLLNLGFGHRLKLVIPKGLQVHCRKKIILLSSFDRVKLYNFAELIRRLKPLNAYKARGIKFFNEQIILKPGKQSQFK